ncbi:hypothetical protein B0T26DRAFT_673373 [Lasiosphaeria miniovina]|uniref:Uncharacterized protein n=1 Tax=Lasiosphaeria miniovina TaxID=1954250 RepID=A0AA40AT76_9PEZI|nr:uncharacterized protein B0T26DRAFT_673373 [Lasiosphaeria miniovina]KAK0721561.1 hypothetical protein B0T26DRAFT_673373 [Lasiosphaeria miniovina]
MPPILARLIFLSDDLPEILQAPPIQWRAVLSDCCFVDQLGLTYERTIMLGLVRDRNDRCYWEIHLTLTSRDGSWLTSLSREETASFVSLDSIIRVAGWVYPERDSLKNSVMFYAKTPGLESHGHGQPSTSHLGVAHDEEVRQLVDDGIENLIRGGACASCGSSRAKQS